MSDIVIILDSEVSIESILSVAEYAADSHVHLIIPKCDLEYVESEWTFELESSLYACNHNDIYCVAASLLIYKDISSCLLIKSDGTVNNIDFHLPERVKVECIGDVIDDLKTLSGHSFFRDIDIGLDFYARLKFFLNELACVKGVEKAVLQGKSKLSNSFITGKANATAKQLLGLDELKFLDEQYIKAKDKHEELTAIANYFLEKSYSIQRYYCNSISRSGNLVVFSSFPVAYKYLSVFLYLSAKEMLSAGNYTSSYIMFFRAFEVYCEGLLLSQPKMGKIERFIDEYGNLFEDCFIIPNKDGDYYKPMGFGGKWNAIRRNKLTNTMPVYLVHKIKHHMNMRNVNVLTHGDVFASLDLLVCLMQSITDAIFYFEDKYSQSSFHWKDVLNGINGHFLNNIHNSLGLMMLSRYEVNFVALK
ncbi:hypothetical protein WMQ67_03085 [Vibrio harveyi]|uniref:hypothetical protein n=1 Tax=Vibrio harveyi TaxID=669 RepID=UPI0037519BC0